MIVDGSTSEARARASLAVGYCGFGTAVTTTTTMMTTTTIAS
jgi:hypothetical protein